MDDFRVIEDYPNYSVSSCGKIKNNTSGNVLKTFIHKSGYEVINIKPDGRGSGKTLKVHRLVAKTFLPPCPDKNQVNHIDGDKCNNKVENLEWVTPAENMRHAIENGLVVPPKNSTKFTEDEAKEMARLYKPRCKENGARALARKYNTNHSVILNTLQRVGQV